MSVPMGITVPKMLPITGTWSLPFAVYFITLSSRVIAQRLKNEKHMCDSTGNGDSDELLVAKNAHANFTENVPLALLLASIVELNGGDRKVLSGSLGALLLLRILHVEFGMMRPGSISSGQPVGYYGTLGFIGGLAGYAAYLVKGYWGL